jgi:hypothetical protein
MGRFFPLKFTFLGLGVLLILLGSCEEDGPDIRLKPPEGQSNLKDTTYRANSDTPAQAKKLLVEDFTAVRCNNCPKAGEVIKSLKSTYGDTVIALGIHCNRNFSRPYEESDENYRLDKGQAIYEWFGKPRQPSGMLDRYQFSGQSSYILSYQRWESLASKRMGGSAKTNIYLDRNFSQKAREVKVTVRVRFQEALDQTVYLSLMVTENNIVDIQLGPDKKLPQYEHNHVVRYIQTPAKGLNLIQKPDKRQVVVKEFVMPIESDWKVNNLNIVAFTHLKNPKGPVLQAQKIAVN